MSLIACIKQVPDTEAKIYIHPDGSGIEEENLQWILNPYDEYALEEALLFKEKMEKLQNQTPPKENLPDPFLEKFKVHAISLGPLRAKEILLKALAMGADSATHIQTEWKLDSLTTAKAIAVAIESEQKSKNMIFTGKLSIDNNQSAVPQMLAEFLNLPHITGISKLEILNADFSPSNEKQKIRVERDLEEGKREVIAIDGPAVIGTTKGLNTPRVVRIPALIRAKRKPLKIIPLEELNLKDKNLENFKFSKEMIPLNWKNFSLPKKRKSIHMIEEKTPKEKVKALVRKLKEVEKVL